MNGKKAKVKDTFATIFKATLICALLACATGSAAATLSGLVFDAQTKETLPGATIMVEGTSTGTTADIDGRYTLALNPGTYTLIIRYVGYKPLRLKNLKVTDSNITQDFALSPLPENLGEVTVVARANQENERTLQQLRANSVSAVENMGAQEMGLKGLADVEQGVKKLSGVSVADEGNLIVRGLGDRYSLTELNGLTIASPNPDNKLIPLSLFPASTVQDITVSKVFTANTFADYSGALINIQTKNRVLSPYLNLSLNIGGYTEALGKDTYRMDGPSLLKQTKLASNIYGMSLAEFDNYAANHNIFPTSMDVEKHTALPDFGLTLNAGRGWDIGPGRLDATASLTFDSHTLLRNNSFYKNLEATGNVQNDFSYDDYVHKLNVAGLASLGYSLKNLDRVGYTFFYARDAEDTYKSKQGVDAEGHNLIGSNSVTHIYKLMVHQLEGRHTLFSKLKLRWSGSYGTTSSDEPDRRQMMFIKDEGGNLSLFKLNRQETMRYFGSLDEDEWIGRLALRYAFNDKNALTLGADYKDKHRDYQGTRFYYNLTDVNPHITDILRPSEWLDMSQVTIERKMQPKDSYRADMRIAAAYVSGELKLFPRLTLSPGLRFEHSLQRVDYASDGGEKFGHRRTLEKNDLFPTLNAKYNLREKESLRLSLSRTVTRPQFIEMAPFLYQESYGAAQIRGNADLQNGYNYNLDLRYELFFGQDDMVSLTGYFKYLDSPIERVQLLNGGATEHTFYNADNGIATGVELELRKRFLRDFRLTANFSYMYTNVKLPEGGAYTNKSRALQGASPVLLNADLMWRPRLGGDDKLSLALLYNLQGSRIHAVGVSGLGDVKQDTQHTLNFNATWELNSHLSLKARANDLLSQPVTFRQEIPLTGEKVKVEQYKEGINFEIGVTYKL